MLNLLGPSVSMPLTVSADRTSPEPISISRPYGFNLSPNPLSPEFSPSISYRYADSTGYILRPVISGTLTLLPPTDTNGLPALELRPLPITSIFFFSTIYPEAGLPARIIYGNLDLDSSGVLLEELLASRKLTSEEGAEFRAGNLGIKVSPSDRLGFCATDPNTGEARFDLSVLDEDGFWINPSFLLRRVAEEDRDFLDHPVLKALKDSQHSMILGTLGKMRFVKSDNFSSGGGFDTPETAAGTISAALVVSEPGDAVVILDSGLYTEDIVMPDGVQLLSIASLGNRERPPIDSLPTIRSASPGKPAVHFRDLSRWSHVSGFSFPGEEGAERTSGIIIERCQKVEIARCYISKHAGANGGGVLVVGSENVRLGEVVVQENSAREGSPLQANLGDGGFGGGVLLYSSGESAVENCKISANRADTFGGGIGVRNSFEIHLRLNEIGGPDAGNVVRNDAISINLLNLEFEENPQGGGGGIGIAESDVHIALNTISSNVAGRGGGVNLYANVQATVEDNLIFGNRTREPSNPESLGGDGGGIAVNNISTTREQAAIHRLIELRNNFIYGNRAADDGGGVYATARSLVTIDGGEIYSNEAGANGGGIRITFGSLLRVKGCQIHLNRCNLGNKTGAGGGVAVFNSRAFVEDCNIYGNEAEEFGGGGVYGVSAEYLGLLGLLYGPILSGAYDFEESLLAIKDCLIPGDRAANRATVGGGLYVVYRTFPFRVLISESRLGGNDSSDSDPERNYDVVFERTDGPQTVNSPGTDADLANLEPLRRYFRLFHEIVEEVEGIE